MPPLKEAEISECYIFYDFKCRQNQGVQHAVNFIYAMGMMEKNNWEFKGETLSKGLLTGSSRTIHSFHIMAKDMTVISLISSCLWKR